MFLLLLAACVSGSSSLATRRPMVMPWMCLERCFNTTASDVDAQIKHLALHSDVITDVSFELFNLGPNSTLVTNTNLSPVAKRLKKIGFGTYAMISSYPYPPNFIDWLHQLWSNPYPFIGECISAARTHDLTGFNVDFEPAVGTTTADAALYAQFLDVFAVALHKENISVTVDFAGWSVLWDFSLLNSTKVDRLFDMSTYTRNFTTWQRVLNQAIKQIDASKLAIGLMTYDLSNNDTVSQREVAQKLDVLTTLSKDVVNAIGIWVVPIPDFWFPLLKDWQQSQLSKRHFSSRKRAIDLKSSALTSLRKRAIECTVPCNASEHRVCNDGICVCQDQYYEVRDVCEKGEKVSTTGTVLVALAAVVGLIVLLLIGVMIWKTCSQQKRRVGKFDNYVAQEDEED